MKQAMKRWMALLLAVVMTVSLLPTSAWAASITDDVGMETPVLDADDPVADTQGGIIDDGELPENPVDPDPAPAEPSRVWEIEKFSVDEGTGEFTVTFKGTSANPGREGSGNWSLLIAPNVKAGENKMSPQRLYELNQIGAGTVTAASLKKMVVDNAGLTEDMFYWTGSGGDGAPAALKLNSNGSLVFTGTMPTIANIKAGLNSGTYTLQDGSAVPLSSIPFVVIFCSQEKPVGKSIKNDITLGGGIADAVWVLDLNAQTVFDFQGEVDSNAKYDKDQKTVSIPLYNTGNVQLMLGCSAGENVTQLVSITTGNDVAKVATSVNVYIDGPDGFGTLDFTLPSPAGGQMFEVMVPHYQQTGPTSWELASTSKLIVYIVEEGRVTDPITFYVQVGSDGIATIKPGTSGNRGISIPGDGWFAELVGGALESTFTIDSGAKYGLSFDWGTPVNLADPDGNGWLEEGDEGTIYYDVYVVSGSGPASDGSTAEATSSVTLDPSAATIGSWAAGTYSGQITLKNIADYALNPYPFVVPINIVVEKEAVATHTVTYQFHDGVTPDKPVPVTYGNKDTFPAYTTRTGYTPTGWFADATGGTPLGAAGDATPAITGNVTYHLQWKLNEYTVTFMQNHDSTDTTVTDTKTVSHDGTVGVGNMPTPATWTGHTFQGWYDTSAATGGTQFTGTTQVTADKTVYARWTTDTYAIHYDANGHGSAPADQTKTHGVNIALQPVITGVTGWTCTGWNTAANGGGTSYAGGANYTADAAVTLYAQWEQIEYTIKWNIGYSGGTNPSDTKGHYGDTLTPPSVSRTGYTFAGWKDASNNDPTATIVGNAAYTAKWTLNGHTVTYYRNSSESELAGVTIPGADSVNYGASYAVKSVTAPTGWQFDGWAETSTGAVSTTYVAGTTITMPDSDLNLYAKWTHISYTVTFNNNESTWSGTDTTTTRSGFYNATLTPPADPTHDGYVFAGWYTAKTGGTAIGANPKFPANNTTTYYAHWTANTVTVTAKLDTGTAYMTGESVELKPASGSNITGTLNSTTGAYTFNAVPNGTYTVLIDSKAAYKADGTALTVTVNDNTQSVEAWWYTAKAITGGNGTVTVSDGTNSQTTGSTSGDSVSIVVPSGTTVTWTATPATNYVFSKWQNGAGTDTTAVTNVSMVSSADRTRKGFFGQGEFTGSVTVTWDGVAPTGSQTANVTVNNQTKAVKVGTTSVTFDNLIQGTSYPITVDDHSTTASLTKDSANQTVNYIGVVAVTGGNGTVTVTGKDGADKTFGTETTAATANNTKTLWVLSGAKVTWSATPSTYYQLKQWEDAASGGSTTINVTDQTITAKTTRKAVFEQKTGTVTVNFRRTPVGGSAAAYNVTGTAKLNGTSYSATLSTAGNTVTITGVPQSGTSYDLYFENVDTTVNVTVNAANVTATVDFYEMQAISDGNGTATVTAGTGALAVGNTTASTTSATAASITVMKGGSVSWSTSNTTPNYTFHHWDTNTTTDPSVASASAAVSHTAHFSKTSFDTHLILKVNNVEHGTASASDADISEIQLTYNSTTYSTKDTSSKVVYNSTTKKWDVTGITTVTGATGTWTVITKDGGKYTETMEIDGDATKALFGVKVVDTLPTGCASATVKGGTGSTAAARVVVPVGDVTAAQTPSSGYAFVDWQQTAAPAILGISGNTVTLQSGYTNTADLVIKPTYTYGVTVTTKYNNAATNPGGAVTLKHTTEADKTVSATSPGVYDFTGLTVGETYNVWVNGFRAGTVTVKETDITNGVTVTLYKVTTVVHDDSNNAASGGTAYVEIGGSVTGTGTSIYLPQGATTAATAANTVSLAAAAGSKYRLAKGGVESDLWTVTAPASGSAGGSITSGKENNASATLDITALDKDIEVVAHFVRRYEATVKAQKTGGGTCKSTANFVDGTNKPTTYTVDHGSYVQAEFNKAVGESLEYWSFTKGELWTKADKGATGGTKLTSGTAVTPTNPTTVYFFPTDDDATLTANVKAATYTVKVKVNLDNEAYTGRKVELKQDNTVKYTLTKGASDPDGTYSGDVLPGTYDIYVDGVTAGTTADTEKDLKFEATDAEGKKVEGGNTVDMTEDEKAAALAKLTGEVNYYTVKLVAGAGGKVDFTATASSAASADDSRILLAKAAKQSGVLNVAAKPDNAVNAHYRFDGWTVAPTVTDNTVANAASTATTYTLPAEADLKAASSIKKATPITVTANFVKQFEVTVIRGSNASTAMVPGVRVNASDSWTASVLVDDGSPVTLNLSGTDATLEFAQWTIKTGTGTGAFDTTKTQYVTDAIFTPTSDVTLQADMWLDATLTDGAWKYDKGTGTGTTSGAGILTWTANSAQTPKSIVITGPGSYSKTLTVGTEITVSGTKYTFDTNYLKGLAVGKYTATYTYDLGTDGHTNEKEDRTKTANFEIVVTAYDLTEASIEVKTAGKTTLNVDSATADDGTAQYLSHKNVLINPLDKLSLTWYYADTAPARGTTPASIPSTWTALTTGAVNDFAGTSGAYTQIPHYPGQNVTALKGKYVFAVAEATSTGSGSVVTNAIPVDYDATITVKEDDATLAAKGDYKVYLWATDETGSFATGSAIEAVWNDTNKNFATTGSKLTGGKSYHVYATTVEKGTAYQQVSGITITGINNTATVNYYTVNNFTTDLKHAKLGTDELGETFAGTPATQFAVKGGPADTESVPTGQAVLSGTTVTASASTAWNQDYKWNWGSAADNNNAGTNAAPTSLTYGTEGQATGGTGKDYTITETAWIGGQLEQRTYTVTGDVKTVNGGGQITQATLTANGRTFTPTTFTNGGMAPATVTFTGIPRTVAVAADGKIGVHYTISATAGADTTIMGYSAPAKTVTAWQTAGNNPGAVTVTPTDTTGRFTIFVETTKKSLTVGDGHNSGDDKPATASQTGSATSTHTDSGVFANYTWTDKTVTISNSGNTPLVVTLGISKGAGAIYSGTEDTSGTLTDGGVTITGLDQLTGAKVTLNPGDSKNFGISTVSTLNAYDDDTYSFQFTSKDARDGTTDGPTVTYAYKMVIDPVTINSVTTQLQSDGSYKVIDFGIQEANGKNLLTVATKANNDTTAPAAGDRVYTWYVAPWNAKVEMKNGVPTYTNDSVNVAANRGKALDKGKGTFSNDGLDYTPHSDERGKALYLVLQGQNNATGTAVTPDITKNEPVVLVPYQGLIQIEEEDALVTGSTEAAKYTVVLRRRNAPAGTADIATTWDDTAKGFATDISAAAGQLWARDPADNTSPAWVYEVWASRVKGDATLQNTGLTITVDDQDQTVDFYKVQIDPTTVDQGIYQSEAKFAPTGGGLFLTAVPTAQPTAATTTGGITVPDDGFVQKGNNVTFTYPDWVKDYTLTWGGAASGTAQPGADGTATHTYSAKDTAAVTTALSLNTYNVQAWVMGMGAVSQITMTLTDDGKTFVFDLAGTGTNILGLATAKTPVAAGESVTFRLPKGATYHTEATLPVGSAANLTGYKVEHLGSDAGSVAGGVDVPVNGATSYDVVLQGDGQQMTVVDNVPTGLDSKEATVPTKGAVSGQASIAADGAIPASPTQTIHLNYNYNKSIDTPLTVELTVTNSSKQSDDMKQILYNVTFTPDATTGQKITVKSNDFAAPITMDENAGAKKVVLEIPNGLDSGTYTYTGVFSFDDKADAPANYTATVTYTLNVIVDKLPFESVTTTTTSGTHSVGSYTVKTPTFNQTLTDDAATGLSAGATKDYLYQWVRADIGVTPTVTWTNGALTVVDGSGANLKIAGGTNATYTPVAADEGKALYLVIYATHKDTQTTATANATGYAISDPITTGYTGLIKINVDGTDLTGTEPNPGYTVKFVPSDTAKATLTGTWSNNGASSGYTATLDPSVDHYTVEVSAFPGATNLVSLEAADGSDVTITNGNRTATAYYFKVYGVDFTTVDYTPTAGSAGETFTAANKQFGMKVGAETLASGTPVLKDQSVAATATGWTQDYTLMWQSANTNANVSAAGDTANTGTTGGSYTQPVTDVTYIGGRLKQNTYTFTGNIRNPAGKTGGTVKSVTLAFQGDAGDTRSFSLTATAATNTGDHVFADGVSDGSVNAAGDTVTFTVVKGAYKITANEGTNTSISAVTLGVDAVVTPNEVNTSTTWATRNEETMTQAQAVTSNGRIFNIDVESLEMSLKVADNDAHEATSTTADNNKNTEHPAVYYFNGVDTTAVPLTLTNGSNTQLTVTGTATRTTNKSAIDFVNGTGLGSALASGDKVTVTGLPSGTAVAAGANLTGVTLSVAANAANTDDAVYVLKFTSATTDTEGNAVTGPTVYYVFDLTVKPLPIKTVEAERLSDGKLQLKGYAAGTADSGLANIKVAYDDAGTTAAANAKDLHDSDFSYVWAKAAPGVAVDASKFELTASGIAVKSGVTGVDVLTSGTGYNTKQFVPADADQGMNFYLIAYRSGDTANASEFAVSEEVYAQVRVDIKAYRTGKTSADADAEIAVTGSFNVTGTLETATQTAQDGFFTLTEAGKTIDFTAVEADDNDPDKAKYYFKNWGDKSANFTSTTDLTTTYTVTEKDTVIGYYDLLPQLAKKTPGGYNTQDADVPDNRTFEYTANDGSGNVAAYIVPVSGSTFMDNTTTPKQLTDLVLVPASGVSFGETGSYVLDRVWIGNNLKLNGVAPSAYIITFYDLGKGLYTNQGGNLVLKDSGGYAGYDRSVQLRIVASEVNVTAQVEDVDNTQTGIQGHGLVQAGSGTQGLTSSGRTNGGSIVVVATPDDGYVFNGWTVKTGSGTFDDATAASAEFTPAEAGCVVEASFVPGDFTVENKTALVIYGNSAFETGSDTSVAATDPKANGTVFSYAVVNTADMPDWLSLDAATGVFTFAAGKKVNTNVEVNDPTKTTYAAAGAVTDEVVITVRVTETKSGKTKDVTYTVNVEPGTLSVLHGTGLNDEVDVDGTVTSKSVERGAAYKAANLAAGVTVDGVTTYPIAVDENGIPMYNETVLKQLFAYEDVHDQANTQIDTTGKAGDAANSDSGAYANGAWTVTPVRFQGTGEASVYQFTFTYKPDVAAEKWNYTAAQTDMTLTIAKPPVGAQFADAIKNFTAVQNVLKPGAAADYTEVKTPEHFDVTAGKAPEEMAFAAATFRKNESLTYLDTEPTYTVKLKSLDAAIHGVSFNVETLTGFKLATGSAYPTFTAGKFASTDGDKAFDLVLAPVSGKVWIGEHHAKFTLTGYSNAELAGQGGEPDVTATYELIVKVAPKTIASVDVTVTDPETVPTAVTGKTDDNKPVDNKTADGKGNVPIASAVAAWGPTDGPDGKHTTVTITVETDPNYVYAQDDPATTDKDEGIDKNTETTVKETLADGTTNNRPIPDPAVTRNSHTKITIAQPVPYLMHADAKVDSESADTTGPKVDDRRTVSVTQGDKDLGSYTIDLGAYGADIHDVTWTVAADESPLTGEDGIGAVLGTLPTTIAKIGDGAKQTVTLDLSAADTAKAGTYSLTLIAKGKADPAHSADQFIQSTYVFQLTVRPAPSPGGPSAPDCPCKVLYYVGSHGVTDDATIEDVSEKNRPSKVPAVTALDGYVFRGWSLTNPATLKAGEKITIVDPKTVEAKGETMTFYAVIVARGYHEHYVIGYPNGNFGPADNINRASVATIIARAILPGFEEGADYGNPGNYGDVSGHWAESAIAYCSKFGVFKGYDDGNFYPNKPITRQEFALVIARLDGVMDPGAMDFTDIDQAGEWALGGIYTAYAKGWVVGYTDGSFKPLNNIRRDEAVKVFNAYLNRGVDADGLSDLHEYVHSSGSGNGVDEYMTWPDVPKDHWAYYEIVEAANDHEYVMDFESELGYTLPEHWDKSWIDQRWRAQIDNTGGFAALASAVFGAWLH